MTHLGRRTVLGTLATGWAVPAPVLGSDDMLSTELENDELSFVERLIRQRAESRR